DADGTLAQLGGDLVALLDALDLGRADLCGFSLGGTIVVRVAIDYPERVGRLVPVATSSRVGRAAAAWYDGQARQGGAGVGHARRRGRWTPTGPASRRRPWSGPPSWTTAARRGRPPSSRRASRAPGCASCPAPATPSRGSGRRTSAARCCRRDARRV